MCNFFQNNECVWIIVILLLVWALACNNNGCNYGYNDCGVNLGNGCGCGR